MKSLPFLSILFLAFFMLFTNAQSTGQRPGNSVNINVMLSPPYSPRLFDYLIYESKPVMTLTNTTGSSQQIKLVGSLEGDNGVSIATKQSYQPAAPMQLGPFEVKAIMASSRNLDFLSDNNITVNASSKVKNSIIKDGILPEGNYTFCIQAIDYQTGQSLSAAPPGGCTMLSIGYLHPPSIISPIDQGAVITDFPQFSWTPVVGNTGGTQINYDLYLLELQKHQNPNDAMRQAVNYNVGNPLKKTDITTTSYVYSPSDWGLEDSATYALQVVASDPNGQLYFVNNGESEVITFQYLPPEQMTQTPDETETSDLEAVNFSCNCTSSLPTGDPQTNVTVNPSDQFYIGEYTLTVTSVTDQPDNQGRFSGEGTIPFPLSSGTNIPVLVSFSNLQVNSSDEVLSGFARGQVNQDALFIPETGANETVLSFSETQANDLANYFTTHTGQLVSNAQSGQGSSVQLPLGIDKMSGGQEQIIAITGMYFTPEKASVDAACAINMPDAVPAVMAFGRKYICLNQSNLCSTPAAMFLPEDISLQFLTGQGSLTLLGAEEQMNMPSDSGTYVTFDQTGFEKLRIQGEYAFPTSHIVKPDDTQVTASLIASAASWVDWIGNIMIEEDFNIAGIPDFLFPSATGIYDHSDVRNPEDLPDTYTASEAAAGLADWHGIYCPQTDVELPAVLKRLNSSDPLGAETAGLVFDAQGASFYMDAANIMDLSDGDLDGWEYSIEAFHMDVFKNAILEGSFEGKILLPVAPAQDNDSSQLAYTCMLGMDNGAMHYQFTVDSTQNAALPMWKAEMSLEPTSSINVEYTQGEFQATADLNGSMNIRGNLGQLKKLKLQNMEFENLALDSESGSVTVGTFSAGEDGDKKLGGFPLTIEQVRPKSYPGPGLELSTSIGLCDISAIPMAETALSIYGKQESNAGRTHYVFDDGVIDSIQLDGDLSVVKIKGTMVFFNDDLTFGDGFKGMVEAEFPNIVKVQSTIQFGEMETNPGSYKYWYVDAMADIKAGFPLFPPTLMGYGFGGGAYYHMERTLPSDYDSTITTQDPANHSETGDAPSGVQYLPNKDILFGLKAMLFFGLQERNTFNAEVTMELDINSSGGINNFFLYGEARALSKSEEGKDKKKAMVKGGIDMHYDVPNEIFHADMNGELNFKVVKATIPAQFHFEPAGWYIYMGRPRPHEGVEVTILDKFDITSYFEAGTMNIDPIPPIPEHVKDILQQSGVDYSFFGTRDNMVISSGKGMICGADMQFDYSGSYLIFKGSLDAQAGYDLSIKKYTTDCEGNETADPVGINGWYAYGQIYAGVEALISIHVDLAFVEKDINILNAGAGAALLGGLPNPTWVKGAVGGYFSILSGTIEGSFNYKFSYGNECVPSSPDVLESMEVIAEILPEDQAADIEIDILPAVATNLRITDNEFTLEQVDHESGDVTERVFRFSRDNLSFEMVNKVNNQMVNCTKLNSSEDFGIFIKPSTVLQPETEFEFTVTATVDEFINGTWQRAEKEDGTLFEEVHSLTFTTNEGLQNLSEDAVRYTMPYPKQRNFCYMDVAQGGIYTLQNIDFEHFDLPGPDEGYDQQFIAKFVPVGAAQGSALEVAVTDENGSFEFTEWPNLQPETVYCVQFIGRWSRQQEQPPISSGVFEFREIEIFNRQGSQVRRTQREINMERLQLADNEKKLYTLFFRTSQYQGYQEKLQALATEEMVLSTEYSQNYSENAAIAKYLYLDAEVLDDQNLMLTRLREQLNLGSEDQIEMLAPYQVCLAGGEPFDEYDIYGYSKSYQQGDNTYTYDEEPMISIDVFGVNQWAQQLFAGMVDLLASSGQVRRFALPGYSRELGGFVTQPPELDAPTAPPLSENEIYDGTQLAYYQGSYSSACSQTRMNNPIPQQPSGNSQSGMTYELANTYLPLLSEDSQGGGNIGGQMQELGVNTDYGLGGISSEVASGIAGDKNVMNITYRFTYEPGSGFNQTPNNFINKAMGYTDPAPNAFGSYYSNVGQAYDMAKSELGSLSGTNMGVSAKFNGPANSSATQNQLNMNLGNMSIGNF